MSYWMIKFGSSAFLVEERYIGCAGCRVLHHTDRIAFMDSARLEGCVQNAKQQVLQNALNNDSNDGWFGMPPKGFSCS